MRVFFRYYPPLCLAALVFALTLIATLTQLRIKKVVRTTDLPGLWTTPPKTDLASPTGLAMGQRNLLVGHENVDGLHWIMQTQQMFTRGEWRIRHVDYDNSPDGREVHWASPFRWWLGINAWLYHLVTDLPLPSAVERAALYVNPLLLALSLLILVPLLARRFGQWAAATCVLCSVGFISYQNLFGAADPDHHGIATLFGLLSVLFLVAGGGGWVRASGYADARSDRMEAWFLPEHEARRWFIAAACAGAIGLWISAASEILILIGIGLAAILVVWTSKWVPCDSKQITFVPILWRHWGIAGASASIAAYLVEYFPTGSGCRLEVNHPLFALAWGGAGWLLTDGASWRLLGIRPSPLRIWLLRGVALAALLAPLVVIVTTYHRSFWVGDSFLYNLHRNYIEEFQPLFQTADDFNWVSLLMTLPFVAVMVVIIIAFRRPIRLETNLLLLGFVPGGVMFLFALGQTRWCGVATGLILVGFTALVSFIFDKKTLSGLRVWIAVYLLVCASATPLWAIELWRNRASVDLNDVYQVTFRDLAHWLRNRAGGGPCVIACTPAISSSLVYDGGIQTLGTLYWENRTGLHETAALFAARTDDDAYRIIQRHGITQLVVVSGDEFLQEYVRLIRNLPRNAEVPTDTFAFKLMRQKNIPAWLRVAPYRFPTNGPLAGKNAFVFEVVSPQTPLQADVAMTHYMIEIGEIKTASEMVPLLERSPEDLAAWIARGRVAMENHNQAAFSEAMETILKYRTATQSLSVEERIHLAILLAKAGQSIEAREEFDRCGPLLDEYIIRHLPASVLFYYLLYAPMLNATPLPENLYRLLVDMLPPGARAQLPTIKR